MPSVLPPVRIDWEQGISLTIGIAAGGTPAWNVFSINGGYRVSESLGLNGGVENLLDEPYRTHG